jgi:hypothetical protein
MINSEESAPTLFAWCAQSERADACIATLSSVVSPGEKFSLDFQVSGEKAKLWEGKASVDEAFALLRSKFTADASVEMGISALPWGTDRGYWVDFGCYGDTCERRWPRGPLRFSLGEREEVFAQTAELPYGPDERDLDVESAVMGISTQRELEGLLVRLCAPDTSKRLVTGTCAIFWQWDAPIETCATYHAEPGAVVRDLALSWIHLHEGDEICTLAGSSLDALHARVAAARPGAQVPIATYPERVFEHGSRHLIAVRTTHTPHVRVGLPSDAMLSREAVLAALSLPSGALLEALEASALPDDEWRTIEPRALEMIAAIKGGAPTHTVNVSTRKHIRFLEQRAPYHVRRLPNGGVMLSTHPYRTLWQLYEGALFLLGIDPSGS